MLSLESSELTGLGLSFMLLTVSNCGLFRAPVLIVPPVGIGEEKKKEGKGRKLKGIKKERKEGRKEGRRNIKRSEEI